MPADFIACVASGGKVRTKSLKRRAYIRICKDSKGWHAGEPKKKQVETKR